MVIASIALSMYVRAARGADASDTPTPEASLPTLLPLITDEAVAGVVIHPRRFFDAAAARQLPVEVVSAELQNRLGVDPSRVEFAIGFVEQVSAQSWSWGMIIRLTEPCDWRNFPEPILQDTVFGQLNGRPYRKGRDTLDASLLQLNPQVMVLAPDDTLCRMLGKRDAMPSDETISQQLSQGIDRSLDVHMAVNSKAFRPLVAVRVEQPDAGECWQAFGQLLEEVERFEVRMRISGQLLTGVVLESALPDGGMRIQDRWTTWCEVCHRQSTVAVDVPDQSDRFQAYVRRSVGQLLSRQPTRAAGNRMQWGLRGDTTSQTIACAAAVMLIDSSLTNLPRLVEQWSAPDGSAGLDPAQARAFGRFSQPAAAEHR